MSKDGTLPDGVTHAMIDETVEQDYSPECRGCGIRLLPIEGDVYCAACEGDETAVFDEEELAYAVSYFSEESPDAKDDKDGWKPW